MWEVKKGSIGVGESSKGKSRAKVDRLSNLPNELIHRILSTVDAKLAVQTSVLSKRWRHLWTSLPVLNLQDSSFDDPVLFQYFVDHVLSHRDASTNLQVLNFSSQEELQDGHVVDSIIDYVTLTPPVSATIHFLSILAECVLGKLPQLSLCQSLTTLKLSHISTETTSFDVVSLKQLYLYDCRFECGVEELLDPFEGCVNLTCLSLHRCNYYGGFETFRIFAPQLTNLSISWMRIDEVFDSDCVIELSTPKLQYFTYCDTDLYDFSAEVDLPCVEEVDIDVWCLNKDTDLLLRMIELFEMMESAEFVTLSPDMIDVMSMFPDILDGRSSPFTRMQNFELNRDTPSSFVVPPNVMTYLFAGSPGFRFN